eukprot:TRINITY_DN1134_c0_g1_i4.p1 TRINITY_DN1134_c0_g1~~TRINITY_DN1134_c0_g1_i4.p1  ORF type:complete len:256 (+),score=-32.04 TRINITY_DN1134_c0_g1_i4:1181-1948(+)
MPTRLQLLLELSSPTKYLTNQHLPQQEKRSKTHENQFFVFAITIMPKNINIQNKQVAFTKTFLLNQLTQLTFKHKSNYQIYTQIFQLETLSGIFKQSIAKTNHRPQLVHKKYTPHSNPFFYYKKQQITLAKISFIIPMRAVLFRKTQKTIHTYYIIKLVSITSFRSIKQQRLKRLQTKIQNPFFVYQNCFMLTKFNTVFLCPTMFHLKLSDTTYFKNSNVILQIQPSLYDTYLYIPYPYPYLQLTCTKCTSNKNY